MTCPCHAEPYRDVVVDGFTHQVCAVVARAIEADALRDHAAEARAHAAIRAIPDPFQGDDDR